MSAVAVGTELPERTFTVDSGRMKVFSLVTDDPNPIHWDPDAVAELGLGDKLINQGGLNVAYVLNAVADWAGSPARITSFTVRFLGNVLENQQVTAGGVVTAVDGDVATLDVWLQNAEGVKSVGGTATVALG